jgi:selenocysteine lyase/cysteine desulfurase
MDPTAFRSEFPVLERAAYLNAGTNGPVPRGAAEAAAGRARAEAVGGRAGHAYFEGMIETAERIRSRLSALLGCSPDEVALTRSTTDGVSSVLSALDLRPGDEVLTSDEEHPGVLAPLAAARRRTGIRVRFVPFAELPGEVGPRTRLVACSHVSWVSGRVVDAPALADSPAQVLLDGAQGLGAIAADVRSLGCDFYAASGQKWLCGPQGSGCLYVRGDLIAELPAPWPGYLSVADPGRAFESELQPSARRFDLGLMSGPAGAWWDQSLGLLEGVGWAAVHERATSLAERLAELLAERGRAPAPRGPSTLVSWHSPDSAAEVERLEAGGVLARDIPGSGLVRASVGAWSNEEDLDRLVAVASA